MVTENKQKDIAANNKRIAKNTLMLYIRMLFMMGVSLFTSRVILQTLGVEDYGIYNVVGGIITMFTFINSAMISATQRYITFALGQNDLERLRRVFSTSLQIHALISLIIVILGETVGLWFLYEKMIIPESRMTAALWVYQCSILACIITIMSVPYNAAIVAHEKMSAFAYISILEVSLKLAIVYLLLVIPFDKLIIYAILMFVVQLLVRFVYANYCSKHFEESKYQHFIDKPLLKEMSGFAGWSFWGSFSVLCCNQGVNLLLNTFYGPVVNAARGIATTIQAAVNNFSSNFQVALNPQIIKTYAVGNLEEHRKLILVSAKFSALMLMIISLPILLDTGNLLNLWLGEVPDHTINFVRIILVISIWDSTAYPLATSVQATGRVKKYQLYIGSVILLIIPVSYVVFQFYLIPELALLVHLFVAILAQLTRLWFVRNYVQVSIRQFIQQVYTPLIFSFVLSLIPTYYILEYLPQNGFLRLVLVSVISILLSLSVTYIIALNRSERKFLHQAMHKLIVKIKK